MSVLTRLFSPLVVCAVLGSALHGQQTPVAGSPATGPNPPPQEPPQSLADMARKLRKDKPAEVRMTDVDTKELFRSVERVLESARKNPESPKHPPLKKQVGEQGKIKNSPRDQLARPKS